MAMWHFLKNGAGYSWKEGGKDVSCFDDGLAFMSGEDGFSRTAADTKAGWLGSGVTAEYTGTPNWHARIEADERKALAGAELDAMLSPPLEPVAVINARFDEMLTILPDRADDIEAARSAELAALSAEE